MLYLQCSQNYFSCYQSNNIKPLVEKTSVIWLSLTLDNLDVKWPLPEGLLEI